MNSIDTLYIHGYASGANPNNPKIQFLESECNCFVRSIDTNNSYEPSSYESAIDLLLLEKEPDLIVGSSLGGYWGYRIARKYAIPFVLFNPVINPSIQLMRLDENLAAEYELVAFKHEEKGRVISVPGLVFLSINDPILDATIADSFFDEKCKVVRLKDSDDHRLSNPSVFGSELKSFIIDDMNRIAL